MRTFLHLILALSILVGLVLFGFPVSAASQINPETGINIVRAPGDPVTVTLTSTPEGSAALGQAVTFTAVISSPEEVITGSVDFLDGEDIIAPDVPVEDNTATFTTAALPVGDHAIRAVYSGDENNDSSQSEPLLFSVEDPAPDNRIEIIIDHTKISQNLTHFPVLIHLSAASGINRSDVTEVFDELGDNYSKIMVTGQDEETQLYVEVEEWDSSREEAWLWVSRSGWNISRSHDTILYLFYDADMPDNNEFVGVTGSSAAQQVWDPAFMAVYHMNNGPDASYILDSTANGYNGLKAGVNGFSSEVAGAAGRAQLFDGIDDYIDIGSECASITTDLTIEAFFNSITPGPPAKALFSTRQGDDQTLPYELGLATSGTPYFRLGGGDSDYTIESWRTNPLNEWSYIHGTISGSNMRCGMNAEPWRGMVFGGNRHTSTRATLGMAGPGTYKPFAGRLDEIRLSTVARSTAWTTATNYALKDRLVSFNGPVPVYSLNISSQGEGTVSPEVGNYSLTGGTEVYIMATPAPGWFFGAWGGDLSGTMPSVLLVMDGNKNVTANFTTALFTLTVTVTGEGEVIINPEQEHYYPGDVVELTAVASDGWRFSRWAGAKTGETQDNQALIVMESDRTIRAIFSSNSPQPPSNPIPGGGFVLLQPVQTVVYLSGFADASTLTLDGDGVLKDGRELRMEDGNASLVIPPQTRMLEAGGGVLKQITAQILTLEESPEGNLEILRAYALGPEGAVFNPALTLTIRYSPEELPPRSSEDGLFLGYFDDQQWVKLDSRVDTESKTVSANISHFSHFALLASIKPLSPAIFEVESLTITPAEVKAGGPVKVQAVIVNNGEMKGSYGTVLRINGEIEDRLVIELGPGEAGEVVFQVIKNEPGEYRVKVGESEGRFVVLPAEAAAGAPVSYPDTKDQTGNEPNTADSVTEGTTEPVSADNTKMTNTILWTVIAMTVISLGIIAVMVMTIRRSKL